MHIWIFQTGEPLQIDDAELRPMRAINLSNELLKRGHSVTILSSDFNHFSKSHRNRFKNLIEVNPLLFIKLIPSSGYSKHVGFSRLWDHFQLGYNLKDTLKGLRNPDIAIIGFPPIESAWVLSRWLTKRNIPYIVDAKDAWPDIFVDFFPKLIRFVANLIFWPYFAMARNVMRNAKGLMAPSELFLNWSLEKANRSQNDFDIIAPLSSPEFLPSKVEIEESNQFWESNGLVDDGKEVVFFIGSLTESFDFDPLIQLSHSNNFRVVIAGVGPKLNLLQSLAIRNSNLIVPGWINQSQLFTLANRSVFSIIPSVNRKDFNMAVNNKFIDSLRLGLPILTSNKSMAINFLEPWGIGLYYDSSDLEKTLTSLLSNKDRYLELRSNVQITFKDHFHFSTVYSKVISKIESFV